MKFTEEQYQKIIKIWNNNSLSHEQKVSDISYLVLNFGGFMMYSVNQALALANPLTREWAYEQFVEKEKRYVWTSKKKTDASDLFMRLFKSKRGYIGSTVVIENDDTGLDEKLTESEIREWGYDPERFDKEEV